MRIRRAGRRRKFEPIFADSGPPIVSAVDLKLLGELEAHGYQNIRFVNMQFCGIRRMMYTVGVFYGLDETGCRGRICFDTAQNAALFLAEWDGETAPEIGVDGCKAIK